MDSFETFCNFTKNRHMKKVFVHLANGFEEVEAITPVDVLRRAGCEVTVVSVTGKREVTSARGVVVQADRLFEDADYYPGGCYPVSGRSAGIG